MRIRFNVSRRRVVVSLITLVVAVLVLSGVWAGLRFWPSSAVPVSESRLATQSRLDKDYQNTDYSFTAAKVVVDPYDVAPLTALVLFSTDEPAGVEIVVHGKDEASTFRHNFAPATEHRLPIYGLYPGADNKVEIKAGEQSRTITITTDPLPEDVTKVDAVKSDKAQLSNEMYFMTPSSREAKPMAFDINGDVRWYSPVNLGWEIKRLENGNLLLGTERLVAKPYYSSGLYEMNLLGKIYKEYAVPGGYHHDYHERKNGNLIVASSNFEPGSRKTVEDYIVEIDRKTGDVIKTIDFADIWPMDDGKSLSWSKDDWFHNNAVYYDEEKDELLLSGRHQDAVVNLDYKTSKINYIIGSPDGWSADMQKYFLKPVGAELEWQWEQHAVSVLPSGDVMLFDNGTNRSKDETAAVAPNDNYSRAVIYRINRAERTIEQVWQYGKQRGGSYFSPYISDADYLAEGNILIHSGGVSYKDGQLQNLPAPKVKADTLRSFTTEIKNGKVVYEIQTNSHFYRAEKMPLYTASDTSLDISEGQYLGKLHQTEAQGYTFAWHTPRPAALSPTYRGLDPTFTRESDRLVMRAELRENDVAHLLLRGSDRTLRYRVPTKDEIQTNAACVDTYDASQPRGEKVAVERYINQNGLEGSFDIYLQHNGQLYDTNQRVSF